MAWWNFQDSAFLIFFIISLVVFLLLSGLILTFSLSNVRAVNTQKSIAQESKTVRIYVIDLKNNNVTYFTRSDLKNKQKISLSQFYLFFNEKSVDKLKNWIYGICIENRTLSDYLEVDIVSKKSKKSYFSILKKVKFDSKVGLLHLESHVLGYTSPNTEAIKKNHGVLVGHVNKEDVKALIEKQKSLSGYTFCVRFFYIRSQIAIQDKVESIIVATLKNVVYKFAVDTSRARQIVDEPGNEIVLFDLTMSDKKRQ